MHLLVDFETMGWPGGAEETVHLPPRSWVELDEWGRGGAAWSDSQAPSHTHRFPPGLIYQDWCEHDSQVVLEEFLFWLNFIWWLFPFSKVIWLAQECPPSVVLTHGGRLLANEWWDPWEEEGWQASPPDGYSGKFQRGKHVMVTPSKSVNTPAQNLLWKHFRLR